METFFKDIQAHFAQDLPFVMYRKPKETLVKGLLQKNAELHKAVDYTESGFVFAPFDSYKVSVFIPFSQSRRISSLLETYNTNEGTSLVDNLKEDFEAKTQHMLLVEKGIAYIQKGEMEKVVLSRVKRIEKQLNAIAVFEGLLTKYKDAFVYCFYHPKVGLWLGATPETLLQVEGSTLNTIALAGTQPYEGHLNVDWDSKEINEQEYVTKFIINKLRALGFLVSTSEVKTVKAGNLLHLRTDITARSNERDISIKDVVNALHPTPAVCGMPRARSRTFITQNESYDRAYYTGFLGELNTVETHSRNNNKRNVENRAYGVVIRRSHLFVNLRCLQLNNDGALIYVGGGITKDSIPEKEWEETQRKTDTMLSVLKQL